MSAFGQYNDIFSNRTQRPKRRYTETDLPFEDIPTDYITGGELRQALTSQEVKNSLEDYSVFSESDASEYEVKAVKDRTLPYSHPEEVAPYIAFEGDSSGSYSHLRLELAAPHSEALDELYEDLDALEEGLDNYFEQGEISPHRALEAGYRAD